MMSTYADDFKMAGPAAEVDAAWEDLRTLISLSDPGPVDSYLGCKHREGARDTAL